jgi:FKBP-type peptidyl-prolyl cis-trans isomerase
MINYKRGFAGMAIIVFVLLALIVGGFWWFMNTNTNSDAQSETSARQELAGGLIIEDVTVGEGDEAQAGKTLSMHYVGTLDDGTVFDSSRERGTPFEFPLGAGMVIQGWEQGIGGMKVGGVRKLTIPAALGYGAGGSGPIPPNSTLHFEVELLGVQ